MKERKHLDQQSVVKLAIWMHTKGYKDEETGQWIYDDGWNDRKVLKHFNESGELNCNMTLPAFRKMRNKSFGPLDPPKPTELPLDDTIMNLVGANRDLENKVNSLDSKVRDHVQSINSIMQDFKTGASIQRDEISDLSKVYEGLKARITELEMRLAKEEMKPLVPKPISLPSWHPDRDKK